MVHALEIARDLLRTDGLLIDIHPTGRPPRVEVHLGEEIHLAGHIQETGNFEEYFAASDALKDVTGRGLIELEREGLFTFLLHAPTVKALSDHLAAEWLDAILPEETIARATAMLDEAGNDVAGRKEIVVREIIHIARFRANGR